MFYVPCTFICPQTLKIVLKPKIPCIDVACYMTTLSLLHVHFSIPRVYASTSAFAYGLRKPFYYFGPKNQNFKNRGITLKKKGTHLPIFSFF